MLKEKLDAVADIPRYYLRIQSFVFNDMACGHALINSLARERVRAA